MSATIHTVILAAGKGTRMKSARPKVLQTLAGQPLLDHVINRQARAIASEKIHVVYGHGGGQVKAAFSGQDDLLWAEQAEQLGTGHAVAQALPNVPDEAIVLVLYGDVPLVTEQSLTALCEAAQKGLAILTVEADDPTGYGRIVRKDGAVLGIVEQKDASPEQLKITEVNTGLLAVKAAHMKSWVGRLGNNNAQGEYYLTDCVALAVADAVTVSAVFAQSEAEVAGVNDRRQLAELEREFQYQQAQALMVAGVQLMDPSRFDVRGVIRAGRDCLIDVNCVFIGEVELGDNVHIGSGCVIKNTKLGDGTVIAENSVLEEALVGAQCTIGPFARLRPGTQLAERAKVGNFVETKKAQVGAGSKINHLSYVGDAILGEDVNVGAGTITCNYDGVNKYQTIIEDGAFIGSDTALVAPVTIGARATIGAGSVISKNAPAEQLTVARGRQKTIESWQRPEKKKG